MMQYNGNYTDENGRPVKGAKVFVYTSEGVTATIADADGNPIEQPLSTDEDGNYSYRAEEGYYIQHVWVAKRRVRIENEVIIGPSYRDAAQAAASAALAAAGVGEYANTGAGLAATDEGETFWVDNGNGTGTIYRHDPGPVATAIGKFIKDPTIAGAADIFAGGVPTVAALAADGGSLIGLALGGTGNDAIKFVTSAMRGIPDDGDEDADVTAALQALAAYAGARGLDVQLAPRTFKTSDTITFTTSVSGAGAGTVISCTATDERPAVKMTGKGLLRDFDIDGNVSADPGAWNAGNYDSFIGSTGLLIQGGGVTVLNVNVRNVVRAGHRTEQGTKNVLYLNCSTTRARGNFGDGFISIASRYITRIGCLAKDITRIGFVEDADGGSPGTFCAYVSNDNCHVEDAHDASSLYGGLEYNGAFWAEKSGHVSYNLCTGLNVGQRGFVTVGGEDIDGLGVAIFTLKQCRVSGALTGFIAHGLGGIPVQVSYDDCTAHDIEVEGFSCANGLAADVIRITSPRVQLTGAGDRRGSVAVSPGETVIEGLREVWETTDTGYRDNATKNYGSIIHSGDAPAKLVVRDVVSRDDAGAIIASVVKMLPTAQFSLSMEIEDAYLRGVYLNGLALRTRNVEWQRLGAISVFDIDMDGGKTTETDQFDYVVIFNGTKRLLFRNMLFQMAGAANKVNFRNIDSVSPYAKINFEGCTFDKDVATHGEAILFDMFGGPSGTIAGTTDANHILANGCILRYAGAATANPMFKIDSNTDAAGKLHGTGNYKSANLTNPVNVGKLAASASFEAWGS